ncbi:hypothetical protein [Agarivorans sp. OAG1]|uniref:hypothetical protein n=1 Tax=Agarivorans sp. OAG1 TaxID=3082387 RepID=UPI0030CF06DC
MIRWGVNSFLSTNMRLMANWNGSAWQVFDCFIVAKPKTLPAPTCKLSPTGSWQIFETAERTLYLSLVNRELLVSWAELIPLMAEYSKGFVQTMLRQEVQKLVLEAESHPQEVKRARQLGISVHQLWWLQALDQYPEELTYHSTTSSHIAEWRCEQLEPAFAKPLVSRDLRTLTKLGWLSFDGERYHRTSKFIPPAAEHLTKMF